MTVCITKTFAMTAAKSPAAIYCDKKPTETIDTKEKNHDRKKRKRD